MTAVNCDTLQVSYTVNPLPYGYSNQVSLQDLEVNYQPILGRGSAVTRTVPLNGNPAEGVLCLSNLTADTPYRVTYNVEVMTTLQITVPSDIPNPVQIVTARECDQAGECSECGCISCTVLCMCVCMCDPLCHHQWVAETVTSTPPTGSPTNTGSPTITENPGERGEL